jgi:hypothetical protein
MRRQPARRPFRPIAAKPKPPDKQIIIIEAYTHVVGAFLEASREAKKRHAFDEAREYAHLAEYHRRTLTDLRAETSTS